MHKITPIIILNWNGSHDTIPCVNDVLAQTCQDFVIYLLDNNSEPTDREKLLTAFQNNDKIKLRFYPKNYGFAKAHHKVVYEDILPNNYSSVVLLNNDAFPEPDWLEKLLHCAETQQADMVSCKMIQFENRHMINNLGHKFLNTGEILPIACDENPDSYSEVFENAGASGGAAYYSTGMIKKIGFFDPYFITGYEDAEFGVRAMVAGYKLVFCPDSIVYHKVGASINKVRDYEFTLKIQLDIIYSYFKLMPLPVILINMPFVVARQFLILLLFLLFFRFTYIKVFFHAWSIILRKDLGTIKKARYSFSPHRKLSSFSILCKQEFFLVDNIKRFYTYFIKGQKTIFEKHK